MDEPETTILISVMCINCRHVHGRGQRVQKPRLDEPDVSDSTCPKCGSTVYRILPGHDDETV